MTTEIPNDTYTLHQGTVPLLVSCPHDGTALPPTSLPFSIKQMPKGALSFRQAAAMSR